MESLLKRDDLLSEEIDIWNNLIKWGLAQHSNISQDVTKWNKEQITMVERTLYRYIPLIRFYGISSEDFFYKVLPYKELLPNQLVYKVQEFHMVPKKRFEVDMQSPRRSLFTSYGSDIINLQHFALFASWISQKDVSMENIPCKFNLLYRASRDGNTIAKFHEKTDNKGANIFVAKIRGTDKVIGGYSPFDWRESYPDGNWKSTADSFIFSFDDYKNINTGEIGRVVNVAYAVYGSSHFGPVFGERKRGNSCDIMLRGDGRWTSCPNPYPGINVPGNFEIEDYEVFQVVKKD